MSATLVESKASAGSAVRSGGDRVHRPLKWKGANKSVNRRPAYRVLVLEIRPEFNRRTVLQMVSKLFGRDFARLIDQSERLPITRLMSHGAAATRLAELLTAAGCRCSIEIDIDIDEAAHHRVGPETRSGGHSGHVVHRRLPRWLTSLAGSWGHRIKTFCAGTLDTLQRMSSRFAPIWTPRIQQFVFGIGALATLGVLSTAIPGHTVPIGPKAIGTNMSAPDNPPLAPAIDLGQAMRPLSVSVDVDGAPASNGLLRAATSLGEVTLERIESNALRWALKWNDAKLLELRVESAPSFVARRGGDKWTAAIGEFGDEVALVVDTGEPRSMFCQANKTLLVVLSKAGAAHLHDIPGDCVELETVTVDERRLLMHFYDHAAPSLAYEAGQIVRVVR